MDKPKDMSFEDAIKELEALVEKLETGDVPLEKAINYYQEGMKLSKICGDKLSKVEKQMQQIMNEHGEFEPFSIQEDQQS